MRIYMAIVAACLSMTGLSAEAQVRSAIRQHTEIPAESLDLALRTLAKERGFQLVFLTENVASLKTRGAVGDFTIEEALKKLLDDSPLAYKFVDANTVSIYPRSDPTSSLGEDASAAAPRQASLDASDALAEVVVTAQKRSERLQDVPVSVSAVSGQTLEANHATSLADYAAYVPSLQVTSFLGQPGQVNLALRGITTGSTASNQTVAIYVDDVPVGSSSVYAGGGSGGIDLLPYDVERIEVLEGPQGTLYGASALGGLLKYVTKEPDLTQTRFQAGIDASTIHHATRAGYGLRASANVPLIADELAASLSVSHAYTPGYIDNIAIGRRSFNSGRQDAARLALLWAPTARFSAEFSALYNRSPFDGAGYVAVNSTATAAPLGRYDNVDVEPDSNNVTTQLYVARLHYDAGWANLASISSFSRMVSFNAADGSSIFFPFFGVNAAFETRSNLKKFTQELRLTSPGHQRLDWVAGLFFMSEQATAGQTGLAFIPGTNDPDPVFNPLIVTDEPSKYREVAMFGNGTYKLTDAWDISAGVRGSHNVQSVNESAYGSLFGVFADDPEVTPFPRVSQNKVTYSISSGYHLTPDQMVYARVATGYRPGGANKIAPDAPSTFGPDTTTNFEIGLKSEWWDRRLLVNLTGFYIDWKDTQVTGVTPLGLTYISNAGAAISKGAELTANLTPLRGLTLGLNASFTDAHLTVDVPGLGGLRGDPLPSTPRFSGSMSVHYERPFAQDFTAQFDTLWRYVGARNTAFPNGGDFVANYRLSSYGTLDLSAGVSRNAWSARLFVRNATNRYSYLFVLPPGAPDTPTSNVILQPRTLGLSIDVKY